MHIFRRDTGKSDFSPNPLVKRPTWRNLFRVDESTTKASPKDRLPQSLRDRQPQVLRDSYIKEKRLKEVLDKIFPDRNYSVTVLDQPCLNLGFIMLTVLCSTKWVITQLSPLEN